LAVALCLQTLAVDTDPIAMGDLRDAAELCYYETTAPAATGARTLTFSQNVYGVDLFEISAIPPG